MTHSQRPWPLLAGLRPGDMLEADGNDEGRVVGLWLISDSETV